MVEAIFSATSSWPQSRLPESYYDEENKVCDLNYDGPKTQAPKKVSVIKAKFGHREESSLAVGAKGALKGAVAGALIPTGAPFFAACGLGAERFLNKNNPDGDAESEIESDVVDHESEIEGDHDTQEVEKETDQIENEEVADEAETEIEVPSKCDHTPSTPTDPTPVSDAQKQPLNVTLQVPDSTDPDVAAAGDRIRYCIKVGTSPTLSDPLIKDDCDIEHPTVTLVNLSYNMKYYWDVKAYDDCSHEVTGPVWNFTTMNVPTDPHCINAPSAPKLISPASDAASVSLTPTFACDASSDPDNGDSVSYTLRVSESSNFSGTDVISESGFVPTTGFTPLAGVLDNGTKYYWKVVAQDTCSPTPNITSSSVSSFTTVAAATVCDHSPSAFLLNEPLPNVSLDASHTINFVWGASSDVDSGDQVTYTLQIAKGSTPDFTNPVYNNGVGASTSFTLPGGTLIAGQTYYWRVIAGDKCYPQDETIAGPQKFTTIAPVCNSHSVVDTDFTTGTITNLDATTLPGTLMLQRNSWTAQWNASDGLLPTEATPEWAYSTSGTPSVPTIGTDPVTGEQALHIDTLGSGSSLEYTINPAELSNTLGWVAQWRTRVVSEGGSTNPLALASSVSVEVEDGTKWYRPGLTASQAIEVGSSKTFGPIDTTLAMHTYRIEVIGSNYKLYQDEGETPILNQTNTATSGSNFIAFGDYAGAPDSESYWAFLRFYTGGNNSTFSPTSGRYLKTIDLSTSGNNLGSGATITDTANVPAGASLAIETRSGNTSTPDGTWSSWSALSSSAIASPAARYLQMRFNLGTTDSTVSPKLSDYTLNYCTY